MLHLRLQLGTALAMRSIACGALRMHTTALVGVTYSGQLGAAVEVGMRMAVAGTWPSRVRDPFARAANDMTSTTREHRAKLRLTLINGCTSEACVWTTPVARTCFSTC